jgi:hypothetical protein
MRTWLLWLSLSASTFCAWAPHDRRSLELPGILVVNPHSLSDAAVKELLAQIGSK